MTFNHVLSDLHGHNDERRQSQAVSDRAPARCALRLLRLAAADGLIDQNPVARVKRPRVSDRSSTLGISKARAHRLIQAARHEGPREQRCGPRWRPCASAAAIKGRCCRPSTGSRLTRQHAGKNVKRLGKQIGLPSPHPHALRHTFVTLSLSEGASLRDVQDAARHADPAPLAAMIVTATTSHATPPTDSSVLSRPKARRLGRGPAVVA